MAAGAKIGMKVISALLGIPIGIATKMAIERAWLAARPDDPPRKPSEAGVQWSDAIAWAALSAAGIVVADLVTRRGAESVYHALTGSPPPPAKPGKDAKRVEKASEKATATAD